MNNPIRTKAITMLKDYVKQMRAAGYPDDVIKKKLMENPTVTIPEDISGYGGQPWTGGMLSEFRNMPAYKEAKPITEEIPSGVSGVKMTRWGKDVGLTIPSINDYLLYKQGQPTTQLPNYAELMGQTQPTGQFGQTKQQNTLNALAEYLANYQGKTLGYTPELMEAGVAGYPQEYGAERFRQYAQGKEVETARKAQEPRDILQTLVAKGASPEELIAGAYSIGTPVTMEQAIALAKVGGWIDPADAQKIEASVNKKLQANIDSSGSGANVAALISLIQKGMDINTLKAGAITNYRIILEDEEWNWLYNKYNPYPRGGIQSSLGGNAPQNTQATGGSTTAGTDLIAGLAPLLSIIGRQTKLSPIAIKQLISLMRGIGTKAPGQPLGIPYVPKYVEDVYKQLNPNVPAGKIKA